MAGLDKISPNVLVNASGIEAQPAVDVAPPAADAVPVGPSIAEAAPTAQAERTPVAEPEELTSAQRKDLDLAVSGLNSIAQAINRSIRFQVFEDLGRVFVQVLDSESGDVVKTIPPMAMLETLSRIDKAIGLLIDEDG